MKVIVEREGCPGQLRVCTSFEGVKSKVRQADRQFQDINYIVAKARKTGVLATGIMSDRQAVFGDFTAADFVSQQNQVVRVRELFETLPADVRARFHHSPAELLEFVQNPENRDECIKLKLRPPVKEEMVKVDTPEGEFWVRSEDGVEVESRPVAGAPKP